MSRLLLCYTFLLLGVLISAQSRYDVASGTEFFAAQQEARAGDSIVWVSGLYRDVRMDIDKDGLIVTADPVGSVLFTGVSRAVINADEVTFSGIQYVGGTIGNLDVIRIYGSDILLTQVNIQNYTSHKYLVVDEQSRRTTISHSNFENRLNSDDKNILSILVDDEPGYHKIQHCSFKNFDGIGQDQGIEPIRIGVSTQAHLDSRTLVEYCYFADCDGDGEIISHKARQNVYRYNTFVNNPVAELVLRHGDEGIVYGNFFLNNMGGIRVREGSNHFIFNNYFHGLDRRAIFLQNDPSDPLSDIHIYHNTFIDCEEIRLGGLGSSPPTDVTIANNVFVDPQGQLFDEETGEELWINNMSYGSLGIERPATGLLEVDPQLGENIEGFFQPEASSPIVSAAQEGYPAIPLFPGMDYDHELTLDLMKEPRPEAIGDRALGASEYSSKVTVQPHATEINTGPSYLFDNLVDYLTVDITQLNLGEEEQTRPLTISSNIDWEVMSDVSWIATDSTAGTGDAQVSITIQPNLDTLRRSGTLTISGGTYTLSIGIHQDASERADDMEEEEEEDDLDQEDEEEEGELFLFPNPSDGMIRIGNLPAGNFDLFIEIIDIDGRLVLTNSYTIEDNSDLVIDQKELRAGSYILNIKLMNKDGSLHSETTHKMVRY